MKQIKFSHIYFKMPKGDKADLIQIFVVDKKELSEIFLDYDTTYSEYTDDNKTGIATVGHYPLPNGKLIVLLLNTNGKVWTTIRRWTPEKEKYYRECIGETFEIVVENVLYVIQK